MESEAVGRRVFLATIAAFQASALTAGQAPDRPGAGVGAGVRVPAGEDRFGRTLRLPQGNPLFIKVSADDSGGAFFLSEQPSGRKGGPPKHFHLEVDELFFCLAGDYIVEVGERRFDLKPGDSVWGPRGVPHAFAFVGDTPGRLLIGFAPAGHMEQFFRDLSARGTYFGTGTDEDRKLARERYGIVHVGPPLTF